MNSERNVIDFKHIFSLIFRKLWLIILLALLGGLTTFLISKYLITPKYEAHVNLYVQNAANAIAVNGGKTSGNENKSDISNLKQLTNTYIEVLNDDYVMQEMGSELVTRFGKDIIGKYFTITSEDNIPAEELRDTIFIESVPDTLVLKLKVITKDPEVSVAICNYFAVFSDIYLQKAIGNDCKASYMTWAKYNDVPISPNKMKNTALGVVSAVLLALLIIFIMDFFDDSVRKASLLSDRYGRAVIGEVGHFKGKRIKGEKKSQFVSLLDKYVPFTVIESYKSIRTSIIHTLSSYENKTVSVSSAEPFEGKSITAANIAITLAQGGYKTLLMDADLRNPVQHKIFNISEKKGLATALADTSELKDCIKKSFTDKLHILSAGPAVNNPSELIASENMDIILETLEEEYDYIIIDSPAVNLFTDSIEIAKKVSGMLMVVRCNDTSTSDIDAAISRIEFFEANNLGFILNDIKSNNKHNKFIMPARNVAEPEKLTDAQKKKNRISSEKSDSQQKNNNSSSEKSDSQQKNNNSSTEKTNSQQKKKDSSSEKTDSSKNKNSNGNKSKK